jgi:histidinol dehydrogenase
MKTGAVADHRSREGGAIIYPVYSRRSRGLSVGVNLFPDCKVCSFDCPYCEVFPFQTDIRFTLDVMKSALRSCLLEAGEEKTEVRDICFSGNGEPTMSLYFPEALEAARILRGEFAPGAKLVLITNGTGLFDEKIFALLAREAKRGLNIWLKLDAGTETWFNAMARSSVSFGALTGQINAFAGTGAPFTLQTMICRINGALPSPEEEAAWLCMVTKLAKTSRQAAADNGGKADAGLCAAQIYGKARPAPEDPLAQEAPAEVLEHRAALLRTALEDAGISLPVEVYP